MRRKYESDIATKDALLRAKSQLEHQILLKDATLSDLESCLSPAKDDLLAERNALHSKMASVEKEDEQNPERRVQALLIQLNALTEKCHRLTLDLELIKSNEQNLLEKYSELKTSHETLNRQLETATNAKERLSSVLSEHLAEMTRTAHERDAQSKVAGTNAVYLFSLRCLKDRLATQLEEREKNFLAVKEQNERLTALLDSHSQMSATARKERDEIERKLLEANSELKTVGVELGSLKRKTANSERLKEKN